jgi:transposase-like protein
VRVEPLRDQMAREIARDIIRQSESELSDQFSVVAAECLRSWVANLRDLARTAEQRREAREAVEEFNDNARRFGLEEI